MNSFYEWLNMGGYGLYVWPAYALAAMVFTLNFWGMSVQKNRVRQRVQQWYKGSPNIHLEIPKQ